MKSVEILRILVYTFSEISAELFLSLLVWFLELLIEDKSLYTARKCA